LVIAVCCPACPSCSGSTDYGYGYGSYAQPASGGDVPPPPPPPQ
jgi:hypothetical protein